MIEFGKSLRAAREARGLTVRELAEKTRMAPTTVQELESENFSRIAAPIYGRGFVKLYCEAVNIDPKPLVAEFMELYNGHHDGEIRERPLRNPPDAEPAQPADVHAAEPPLPESVLPPTASAALTQAADAEPVPAPEPDLFRQTSADSETPPPATSQEPTLSRYAAPMHSTPRARSLDPQVFLRLGLLAVGALLILVLLVLGIRAVYRATTPARPAAAEKTEPDSAPVAAKPASTATAASAPAPAAVPPVKAKTARTPQKIPSLYID